MEKTLSEVISKKKKWDEYEEVKMPESCNAILQKMLPMKLKDPGSFNITCVIGNDWQTKALCDSGSSVNLMPLSLFKRLKIGNLKPTTITLQMADKSSKHPNGIVEDVLVKVNDFIFPVDFIVLDMEEDKDASLILGRPFLATGKALIDMARGELTLQMGSKRAIVAIYNAMRSPTEKEWKLEKKHKAMHGIAKVEVKKEEETFGSDMNVPRWLFETATEFPINEGEATRSHKAIDEELKDASRMGKPKPSWWKKRLAKMFLTKAKKKEDAKSIPQKKKS